MSLGSLGSEIGAQIPTFLNQIFDHLNSSIKLENEDIVIVNDMDYFKRLESVLSGFSIETIKNYMGWRMLQRIGFLASDKFRQNELAFRKVQTGVVKLQDMDRRCLDLLSDTTPDLVGRTYVDNFFTKSDKEIANQMIEQVLKRFKEIVQQKDWMDEETRMNSVIKAEKITVNTGYPEWLMDDEELQHEYDFVSVINPLAMSVLVIISTPL